MSWTKKNVHPGKILSTSEEIAVQVLEVDPAKRRISLGLKQTLDNPWEAFAEKFPTGSRSKARSRTSPNSACSSASTATSTAWSTFPTSTGAARAKKRSRTTRRATWSRPRCSTSTSRRSASRSASSSSAGDPMEQIAGHQEGRPGHLRGDAVQENGIEVKIAGTDDDGLHPPQPISRATAPSSGPSALPSARRSMPG